MMHIGYKLAIPADAARGVSCASSGSRRRGRGRVLGSAAPSGICYTYTADVRCVSLLKILLTNRCIYGCAYCVSRSRNDVPRASFEPGEIVRLTIDFYRRNDIELPTEISLKKHMGVKQRRMLFEAWFSGSPDVQTMIYQVVRNAVPVRADRRRRSHLSSPIQVERLAQKVRR